MVTLEFELEEDESQGFQSYTVKRKGLPVGMLILNGDPYSLPEAKVTRMEAK